VNQITSDRQEQGRKSSFNKSSSNWMTLYRTAPGYIENPGGAFDIRYCRHEVQFMPTLVLRENIPPRAGASGTSTHKVSEAKPDRSLEGVLIFSGIGFALMIVAIIFRSLELPPPYF
jgi:hypothetical protein